MRILLIEDDKLIGDGLKLGLTKQILSLIGFKMGNTVLTHYSPPNTMQWYLI
ncbi:transcriptional regulatory protein [Actinobacillus equuli]|nr:transcriptional regulatory protein [Actinobacillus equuli]